jgi:hypothetical protein
MHPHELYSWLVFSTLESVASPCFFFSSQVHIARGERVPGELSASVVRVARASASASEVAGARGME